MENPCKTLFFFLHCYILCTRNITHGNKYIKYVQFDSLGVRQYIYRYDPKNSIIYLSSTFH